MASQRHHRRMGKDAGSREPKVHSCTWTKASLPFLERNPHSWHQVRGPPEFSFHDQLCLICPQAVRRATLRRTASKRERVSSVIAQRAYPLPFVVGDPASGCRNSRDPDFKAHWTRLRCVGARCYTSVESIRSSFRNGNGAQWHLSQQP